MENPLNSFIGKTGVLFLKNNFRYQGKITGIQGSMICFYDSKSDKNFLFNIDYVETFKEDFSK